MTVKQAPSQPAEGEQEAVEHVQTAVEKPTLGRIVHVNVAGFGQEPRLRPAIVIGTDTFGFADAVDLVVFVGAVDFPLPPGVGLKHPDVGTRSYPAHASWEKEGARYGDGPGQWTWPVRLEEPVFLDLE
jgi:hypothetical protein